MQSCTALYLDLHSHATENVRPSAQSANSMQETREFVHGRVTGSLTFDDGIARLQRERFRLLQEGLLLPA